MKDRAKTILCAICFGIALFIYSKGAFENKEVLPEVEEEQLPVIVQHNGHKLLRVDDYEVGKHCYFWHDQVGSMFCIDMAASHDAERE